MQDIPAVAAAAEAADVAAAAADPAAEMHAFKSQRCVIIFELQVRR